MVRKKRIRVYKNEDIFDFIVDFKRKNDGNSPSLRDLCDGLGINSTSLVASRLFELEAEGKIVYSSINKRFIVVNGGKWLLNTEENL